MPAALAENSIPPQMLGLSLDLSALNDMQKLALKKEAEHRACSIPELLGQLVDERSWEILGQRLGNLGQDLTRIV